jgi:hypothetical protein
MKLFCTRFRAIDPKTGELATWTGPNIPAISWNHAEEIRDRDYPYLTIDGQLRSEIDQFSDNKIDYDIISLN